MQTGSRLVNSEICDELGAIVQQAWSDYCELRGEAIDCQGCHVAVTSRDGAWVAEVLSPVNVPLAQFEVLPLARGEFALELVFARTRGPELIGRHEEESE